MVAIKLQIFFTNALFFQLFFAMAHLSPILRGGQVVLTDIEVINFGATGLGSNSQGANLRIGDSGISSLRIEIEGIILIAIMHASGNFFY